ncbi:MAG: alpha/beta hydrolase [Alphaproteobacteria bacterium]
MTGVTTTTDIQIKLEDGVSMAASQFGVALSDSASGDQSQGVHLVWAHGWGQSGAAFYPFAESLARMWSSTAIDFPGFGRSTVPPATWGTEDYADAIAGWLRTLPPANRIWIGHSFGCRVGMQIAARHPGLLTGMVLIAAAGLKRRRSLWETLRFKARVYAFKLAKLFVPEGPRRDALRARFGSADYKNAGPMRAIFIKTVSEDLTDVASQVSCPTLLVFGRNDADTPVEMGERLSRLIPSARLVVLEGFGHLDILTRGQHQTANEIRKFVQCL